MTSTQTSIKDLLAARKKKLPELELFVRSLDEAESVLVTLRTAANRDRDDADVDPAWRVAMDAFSNESDDFGKCFARLRARAGNVRAKFSKSSIDLCMAGLSGQGKSTLLQHMTGLPNHVIPATTGLPVTGTKSRILHRPGESHAVVRFRKEADFLELVRSYYGELGYAPLPATIDAFRDGFAGLTPPDRNTTAYSLFGKIQAIHRGLSTVRDYFDRDDLRIDLTEVPLYVTQFDPADPSQKRFLYLAVESVDIHTDFPETDAVGLTLVDLPGLGEVAHGHEEKLIRALQEEIDAILYVRLPNPHRAHLDKSDHDVLNTIQKALPELNAADWLGFVLNESADGSNRSTLAIYEGEVRKYYGECRIIPLVASDGESVRSKLFKPLLEHLKSSLPRMDGKLLSGLATDAIALRRDIEKSLRSLPRLDARGIDQSTQLLAMFQPLADTLREDIENRLRREVNTLYSARDDRDADLQVAFDGATAAVWKYALPDASVIDRRAAGTKWSEVYGQTLDELRVELKRFFERIDASLIEWNERWKDRIEAAFAESKMGTLRMGEGRRPIIRRLIESDSTGEIGKAFAWFEDFRLGYRAMIQHRISDGLDPLRQQRLLNPLPQDPSAGIVRELLERCWKQAASKVEIALKLLTAEPSKAAFAVAEELADAVASPRVKNAWNVLFMQLRGEIWSDEFGKHEADERRRREWNAASNSLLAALAGLNAFNEGH